MEKLDVIKSSQEPNKRNLWLDGDELKYYSSKGWITISSKNGGGNIPDIPSNNVTKAELSVTDEQLAEVQQNGSVTLSSIPLEENADIIDLRNREYIMDTFTKILSYDGTTVYLSPNKLNGIISIIESGDNGVIYSINSDQSLYRTYTVIIDIDKYAQLISEGKIVLDHLTIEDPKDAIIIKIQGTQVEYTLNRTVTEDNNYKYTMIDVSTVTYSGTGIPTTTELGEEAVILVATHTISKTNEVPMSIMTETLDLQKEFVFLGIGTSDEIKESNLKNIAKYSMSHFPVHIDYGFGVGNYLPSSGGFAHVTTSYGNEVFYDINIDGSVVKNEEYVKPNEPYTVLLSTEQIGQALSDVIASHVMLCGEVVVKGSTGLVTYFRTLDSTSSTLFFSSNRKDGRHSVLSYDVSAKTFTFSVLNNPISPASTTAFGGVKKISAIADLVVDSANAEIIAGKINDILAGLRTAGLLQE